jgi:hypothetical protein
LIFEVDWELLSFGNHLPSQATAPVKRKRNKALFESKIIWTFGQKKETKKKTERETRDLETVQAEWR